ncbi:DNA adenine methylase [Nocardia wallacei]|uniref:DNA adenine methylase n=1 Tax=Nocardia wallacei TaxID=480035 RepID=UPI00245892A0|nr:DNA adenine methylase [Nocardia wallacei]
MRPPFPYYGGKMTVASRIVDILPTHQHYVEPFAGSLAVLLAKPASRFETVNDLHSELMMFWKVLRERPVDLARVCALTPHSRAEYAATTPLETGDELETARRVWVKLSQSRSGLFRATGWRYYIDPAGSSSSMPDYLAGYVRRFGAAAERMHRVSLECRDAFDVIASYGSSPEVCLYVDPPYLGAVRSGGANYTYEMTAESEHITLLESVLRCRSAVVLSGYASELYDTALTEWSRVEIPTFSGNGADGNRTEVVWTNRDIASPTLDLQFGTHTTAEMAR